MALNKGTITSKIKHAIKPKTSPARHAQLLQEKRSANEGCNSCATVVQVLQDLFHVLLHVLFYL